VYVSWRACGAIFLTPFRQSCGGRNSDGRAFLFREGIFGVFTGWGNMSVAGDTFESLFWMWRYSMICCFCAWRVWVLAFIWFWVCWFDFCESNENAFFLFPGFFERISLTFCESGENAFFLISGILMDTFYIGEFFRISFPKQKETLAKKVLLRRSNTANEMAKNDSVSAKTSKLAGLLGFFYWRNFWGRRAGVFWLLKASLLRQCTFLDALAGPFS